MPGDIDHLFPGFTDLVRVLKGMLAPGDAQSRVVSAAEGRGKEGHDGLRTSPSRASQVACVRRAPTVASPEGGPWRRLYIKSQPRRPLMSPVKEASNLP